MTQRIIIAILLLVLMCRLSKRDKVQEDDTNWEAIKMSHLFCANMRQGSASLTTTTVPVKDVNGKNERWFAVSVCCATCLCHFWEEKQSDRFYYAPFDGHPALWRRPPGGGEDEMVQYLQRPSLSRKESEAIQKAHAEQYHTYLDYDRVPTICELMQ